MLRRRCKPSCEGTAPLPREQDKQTHSVHTHTHTLMHPHRYKPSCEGTAPSPREQAAVTFWSGNMVVFGGYAMGGRTNDLYVLDLAQWQWSQPTTGGTAPSPRQVCACVYGGVFVYVCVWGCVCPSGSGPSPQRGARRPHHARYVWEGRGGGRACVCVFCVLCVIV